MPGTAPGTQFLSILHGLLGDFLDARRASAHFLPAITMLGLSTMPSSATRW